MRVWQSSLDFNLIYYDRYLGHTQAAHFWLKECAAKLSLIVKPEIIIIKNGNVHKFSEIIDESTMLNLTTYGKLFHNHRNCHDIRNDEVCQMSTHDESCFKKDDKTLSAITVKKKIVLQQNQFIERSNIIQIMNTNSNLIMNFFLLYYDL